MTKQTSQSKPQSKTAEYIEYSSWGRGETFVNHLIEELAKERAKDARA